MLHNYYGRRTDKVVNRDNVSENVLVYSHIASNVKASSKSSCASDNNTSSNDYSDSSSSSSSSSSCD